MMLRRMLKKRHIPTWTATIAAFCLVSILIMLHASQTDKKGESKEEIEKKWQKIRNMEQKMQELKHNVAKANAYKAELMEMVKSCNVTAGQQGSACNGLLAVGLPKLEELPTNIVNREIDNTGLLGCGEIDSLKIIKKIKKGQNKIIESARYGTKQVAVKSASTQVASVQKCLKRKTYKKKEDCYILANYEVIRENLLLRQIQHSGIPKMLGMCVRSESSSTDVKKRGVSLVVELGRQVDLNELSSMPFQQRLKMSLQLSALLLYLAHSSLGSMRIQKFDVNRFILAENQIKLADVNELTSLEKECNEDYKCLINGTEIESIKCFDNRCIGMNEQLNLQDANIIFFKQLLHAPKSNPKANEIQSILRELDAHSMTSDHVYLRLKSLYRTSEP
ncbi:extracellular tyrosine-protein kinase PKDCC-like [Antedon mediterranea]|uniref:extracellular tyrosine-protein kinase PKDCC-like n=1 Tax=Antedon mediterranea TaxID=105859 RepID=UPI003AF419E9